MANTSKTVKSAFGTKKLKKRFLPEPGDMNALSESFANPLEVLDETGKDLGSAFTPDVPEPEEETIIPIPSGSEAELRARKRRAKAKGSGRSSTILTEGLGG